MLNPVKRQVYPPKWLCLSRRTQILTRMSTETGLPAELADNPIAQRIIRHRILPDIGAKELQTAHERAGDVKQLLSYIKDAIRSSSRTQKFVAQYIGWSEDYLSERLSGKRPLTLEQLLLIADVPAVDLEFVLLKRKYSRGDWTEFRMHELIEQENGIRYKGENSTERIRSRFIHEIREREVYSVRKPDLGW